MERFVLRLQGIPRAWTGAESRRAYAPTRLDDLVIRQAERTPDAAAVRSGSHVVSYAELVRRARRLAHTLRARGVERESLVAICLDRSIDQIVSVLGVLMSGAAYVPIDPHGPAERRRFMLEDAEPRIIIGTAPVEIMPSTMRDRVVSPDPASPDVAEDPLSLPDGRTPQDLAYVIYTSGSTGTPKGVLNQHDGVSNHLAWMAETFPLGTNDRVLGKTSAAFDVSVWEWFWPLSQGACLVLTQPSSERDPAYLLRTIESDAITNVHFVPTLLRHFLERPDLVPGRSLQRVICSGEALTAELRDRFFERMPGSPTLVNLYGPTETAVHVTGWVCERGETGPVPIGRPLPNVLAYVVDEQMQPVAEGVQGELLIGGIQVARGYLRRPDLSRERFVRDPFADEPGARCYRTGDRVSWRRDGVLDFLGRDDSQVQLGGTRVELGEIETVLRAHPAIADAAVLVRDAGSAKHLIAYVRRAPGLGLDPSVEAIRRAIIHKLPEVMLPSRYIWLDEFPLTATGKLDRNALPAADSLRPVLEQAFEAPRPGTESRLADIWRHELGVDVVGRLDDFLALGGNSLTAVHVFDEVARAFGVDLPPSELLHAPTVAQLAARIDAAETEPPRMTSVVTLRPGTHGEALFLPPSMGGELLYWRETVASLAPGRPVYGFGLPENSESLTDLPALVGAWVRDLVALQPNGPYHLAGYSFSAAVALEMAQQLRAMGREVGLLAMIDYGPSLPADHVSVLRTCGDFVRNLPAWVRYDLLQAGWGAFAGRAWRKLVSVGRALVHLGRSDTAHVAERAIDEMFANLPDAHRRLAIEHLDAFYRYQPRVYDGRVLLFWAKCRPLFHALGPTLGWEHFAAGGFDRVVVRCNHDNILKAPHSDAIAAGLDHALAARDAKAASSRAIARSAPHPTR